MRTQEELDEDELEELTTITHKELIQNGFEYQGDWNNRSDYDKNGFSIVEHNGVYRRSNKNNWSGYGKAILTIDELNALYDKWVNSNIKKLEKKLSRLKEMQEVELNKIKLWEKEKKNFY